MGRGNPGKPLSKVKSGCRTCKARKVKCDEGRPACQRCTSTKRVCAGYGIWGGGTASTALGSSGSTSTSTSGSGNGGSQCPNPSSSKPPPPVLNTTPTGANTLSPACSPQERPYFEWLVHKTTRKLPGAFPSLFWDTLILQASSTEPAVMHAALALSACHVDCVGVNRYSPSFGGSASDFSQFQYSKAIQSLQPHLSSQNNDRASVRVALLTCLVFVNLEYLHGRYSRGHIHLKSGLRLLREVQTESAAAGPHSTNLSSSGNPTDDGIIEAFTRLFIQFELMGLKSPDFHRPLLLVDSETLTPSRPSLKLARRQIDRVLNEIGYVAEFSRQPWVRQGIATPAFLLEAQSRIKEELRVWRDNHEMTWPHIENQKPNIENVAYRLLWFYYCMTSIMAETSLWSTCESAFDQYTDLFISIISRAIHFRKIVRMIDAVDPIQANQDLSKSISDVGWIPPLYYTAVKCRVHRVRMHAIRLLRSIPHREGAWDSILVCLVAEKVAQIEEGDFYKDYAHLDNFATNALPSGPELDLPVLPTEPRVKDVQMVLPDAPGGQLTMTCSQMQPDGNRQSVSYVYDVPSAQWLS